MEDERLRYPIGRFDRQTPVTPDLLQTWIDEIEALPSLLGAAVRPLSGDQLEVPYRPGGWCVRQVVHHIADSHMNSLVRFKWALTEDRPTIKAYYEERWAELPDYSQVSVGDSVVFVEALHRRWVPLLRSLDQAQLAREFVHPDSGPVRLDTNVGIYAWHGRHHLAHVTDLIARKGWGLGARRENR